MAFAQAIVLGGVGSKLGGGTFENGAVTGAFGYLFNFCAHNGCFNRRFTSVDAARHYQAGSGTDVWDVDINEINQKDASARWADGGKSEAVLSLSLKYDSGIIYGQIRGTVNETGMFTPEKFDRFDFERHPRSMYKSTTGWVVRNAATVVAGLYYQNGVGFNIYFKGTVQLSDAIMTQLGIGN